MAKHLVPTLPPAVDDGVVLEDRAVSKVVKHFVGVPLVVTCDGGHWRVVVVAGFCVWGADGVIDFV